MQTRNHEKLQEQLVKRRQIYKQERSNKITNIIGNLTKKKTKHLKPQTYKQES